MTVSKNLSVVFEEVAAGSGKKIAVATLNMETSLNAISLEMIEKLQAKLTAWETDKTIACVFLQGAGDKAFCAGGDVVALYHASAAYGETLVNDQAETFFSHEYRLDYCIHTYPKPFIVWGNGIVMGGGLGLLSGASHRVVTESTRMAMPEVTIGLYPDVGGTWFLNRAPGRSGMFLGFTGASINATDAKFVGLADRFIPHSEKADVIRALADSNWGDSRDSDQALVTQVLRRFETAHIAQQPNSPVREHLSWINDICDADHAAQITARIGAYDGDEPWANKAVKGLKNGCPITPYLVLEQLKRGRHLSLADIFRMELVMSVNCAANGHFHEGVRALLIDKDRKPVWQPNTVAEVKREQVEAFFVAPWPENAHPLADL